MWRGGLRTRAKNLFGKYGAVWYDQNRGLYCVGVEYPPGRFRSYGRSEISYDKAFLMGGEKQDADTGETSKVQQSIEAVERVQTLPESKDIPERYHADSDRLVDS